MKYPVIGVRTSVHDANPQLPADRGTARSWHRPGAEASPTGPHLAALSLTTLGVVYGDIGTSPLYALRACQPVLGVEARPERVERAPSVSCTATSARALSTRSGRASTPSTGWRRRAPPSTACCRSSSGHSS